MDNQRDHKHSCKLLILMIIQYKLSMNNLLIDKSEVTQVAVAHFCQRGRQIP